MIAVPVDRISLICALSAIVLAALWPHIRPIIPCISKYHTLAIFGSILNNNKSDDGKQIKINLASRDHPKFSGYNLRRITSHQPTFRSTLRDFDGVRQSSLYSNPSYSSADKGFLAQGAHQTPYGRGAQVLVNNESPAMFFTLFTTLLTVLVIYTLIKMLTAKLDPRAGSDTRDYKHNHKTADLKVEKKSLKRMSREQRISRLLSHHGGKNVSEAMKFLVTEMERQKVSLLERPVDIPVTCECLCHKEPMSQDSINRK